MTKGTRTSMRVFCMASSYFSSKKLSYYMRTVAGWISQPKLIIRVLYLSYVELYRT